MIRRMPDLGPGPPGPAPVGQSHGATMGDENDQPDVDPQPRRRVPPPTIDLEAAETAASRRLAFARFVPSLPHFLAAGIGAAIALMAVVGAWLLSGSWPLDHGPADVPQATQTAQGTQAPQVAQTGQAAQAAQAAQARLDRIEAQLAALARRDGQDGGQGTAAGAAADPKALEDISRRLARIEGVAAVTPGTAASDAALADLNHRLDDAMAAARTARERADAAAKAAEAPRPSAQPDADRDAERAALDALAARVATLESSTKALGERIARGSEATAGSARNAVAALALELAVERGGAYARELAAIDPAAVDKATRDALAPFAASGVPAAAALGRELAALMPAARKATEEPAHDGGMIDRLRSSAQRLVRVRPIGEPPGDDPAAVLARIDTAATRSDLGAALKEAEKLPAPARAPLEPWIKRAQARDAALAAATGLVDRALDASRRSAAQGTPTR